MICNYRCRWKETSGVERQLCWSISRLHQMLRQVPEDNCSELYSEYFKSSSNVEGGKKRTGVMGRQLFQSISCLHQMLWYQCRHSIYGKTTSIRIDKTSTVIKLINTTMICYQNVKNSYKSFHFGSERPNNLLRNLQFISNLFDLLFV